MGERQEIITTLNSTYEKYSILLEKHYMLKNRLDELINNAESTKKYNDFYFRELRNNVQYIHGYCFALFTSENNFDAFWFDDIISQVFIKMLDII